MPARVDEGIDPYHVTIKTLCAPVARGFPDAPVRTINYARCSMKFVGAAICRQPWHRFLSPYPQKTHRTPKPPLQGRCPKGGGLLLALSYLEIAIVVLLRTTPLFDFKVRLPPAIGHGNRFAIPFKRGGLVRCIIDGATGGRLPPLRISSNIEHNLWCVQACQGCTPRVFLCFAQGTARYERA